MPGSKLV